MPCSVCNPSFIQGISAGSSTIFTAFCGLTAARLRTGSGRAAANL